MKKFDAKAIGKLVKELTDGRRGSVPAPFPTTPKGSGYPTRLAVWAVGPWPESNQVKFAYIGKPTKFVAQRISELLQRGKIRAKTLLVVEFDRKNAIRASMVFDPRNVGWGGRCYAQNTNHVLTKYYHPWDVKGDEVGTQWLDKLFLKRILDRRGQVHTVYSPFEKLKMKAHIEPFRAQLTGMGL